MNRTQINVLKQASEAACAIYEAQKAELTNAGFKSQERYVYLKPLKAAADAAHAAYSKFAVSQIKNQLDQIIEADRPAREAAARGRSAWKQAKFDAQAK